MTDTARGLRAAPFRDWYDSIWLAKFIEAKEIIARVAPDRLAEFVAAFDGLRVPPGFAQRCVRGFLDEARLARIRDTIRAIPLARLDTNEMESFGRFIVRDWPEFTELQAELTALVSELAGEPVEPSYNFLSLYTKLGTCLPHLDTPSAKWTLDVCVDQSEPWPIHFSQVVPWPEDEAQLRRITPEAIQADGSLDFTSELLAPGDAVLFSGTNQWHYRDPLPAGAGRQFCDLLFFHYIPRGSAELIQPRNWARLFGILELAEMEGIERSL